MVCKLKSFSDFVVIIINSFMLKKLDPRKSIMKNKLNWRMYLPKILCRAIQSLFEIRRKLSSYPKINPAFLLKKADKAVVVKAVKVASDLVLTIKFGSSAFRISKYYQSVFTYALKLRMSKKVCRGGVLLLTLQNSTPHQNPPPLTPKKK